MEKHEIQIERLMDRALRLDGQRNRDAIRHLDVETLAAVAVCYEAPYNTYGKLKGYLDTCGRLPPEQYRKPRHLWQPEPTPGALCRKCEHLKPEDGSVCPMLMLRGAAGMHGSVVHCSEYQRKKYKKRKRTCKWAGDEEML